MAFFYYYLLLIIINIITFAHYVVVSFFGLSPDGGRLVGCLFFTGISIRIIVSGLNKIAKLDDTTEYYKLLYYSDSYS